MASKAQIRQLNRKIERLAVTTAEVDRIRCFDLNFGRVFASSGFRVAKRGCAVDWALIEVDESRVARNIVSVLSISHIVIHDSNKSYLD